jgi:hypothetical protein
MRVLVLLAAQVVAAGAPVLASDAAARPFEGDSTQDSRWVPWLGCWEPVGPDGQPARGKVRVCVSQEGEGAGVKIVSQVDGKAASTQSIVADGERRAVERDGCRGWESARWSADGKRVFLRSELECDGVRRSSSGVMAFLPKNEWLEVEVVGAETEQATRVVRYRPVGTAKAGAAVEAARVAAAGPLSVEDVIEAVREVGPDVVEPLLLQRGNTFDLDSRALLAMADAGVPGRITDLMIALTYPERFAINTVTGRPSVKPQAPSDDRSAGDLPPPVYDDFDRLDPYGLWRWGYRYRGWPDPYGYYMDGYYYSPFGWWYRSDRPTIIVVPGPSDPGKAEPEGKAVKGRGYTRSQSASSGGSTPRQAEPRSGGSSEPRRAPAVTTNSKSGASDASTSRASSSSTGRKARPRNQSGAN